MDGVVWVCQTKRRTAHGLRIAIVRDLDATGTFIHKLALGSPCCGILVALSGHCRGTPLQVIVNMIHEQITQTLRHHHA
jgi:hypothetical protein